MGAKKWEDTVMTGEVLLQVMGKSPSGYIRLLTATRVQAEVSFKAGYKKGLDDREGTSDEEYKAGKKVGRKEVVEWVSGYLEKCHRLIGENRVLITQDDFGIWRAKLKEWEVE